MTFNVHLSIRSSRLNYLPHPTIVSLFYKVDTTCGENLKSNETNIYNLSIWDDLDKSSACIFVCSLVFIIKWFNLQPQSISPFYPIICFVLLNALTSFFFLLDSAWVRCFLLPYSSRSAGFFTFPGSSFLLFRQMMMGARASQVPSNQSRFGAVWAASCKSTSVSDTTKYNNLTNKTQQQQQWITHLNPKAPVSEKFDRE